ncbi:MAG: hypothetical protein ACOYNY_03330 [Caldilineaceae bacterium]
MITLPQQPRWRICLVVLLLGAWLFGARQPVHAAVIVQSSDDVIYSADERFTAPLDQPFALRPEQSAEIEGEDLLVELFYWDESSGCVEADCQEIEVGGALYTRQGDMQVTTSFFTTITPDEPYLVELESYDILVLNLEEADDGSPLLIIQVSRTDGAADATESADPGADSPTAIDFTPRYVEQCANFSPFDAAVVLQEPINDGEPIANLIFGPLSAEFDLDQQVLYGWCGYTNATEAEADAINGAQPHLLTNLPYAHAVAADHIAFDEIALSDGTLQAGWYDLFALVEVLGAADPSYDSQALAAELSEAGVDAPFLDTLSMVAGANPNTTATLLPVTEENPANSSLWIWQSLDDGYFSLLFSQSETGYDLVIARLGNQVSEQTVLGYSQVILAQLSDAEAHAVTPTSDSPTVADCEQLSVEATEAVVGAPVVGQAVANDEGVGCRFEVDAEEGSIDPTLFSGDFATYGLLVGVIPLAEGQGWLDAVVSELADSSTVVDEQTIEDLLDLIYSDEYHQAVAEIVAIDWQSDSWSVEALTEVEGDTLLISSEYEGEATFYLWRTHPAGGLYFMSGASKLAMDDLRPALVDALRQLIASEEEGALIPGLPTNPDAQPGSTEAAQADPAAVQPSFVDCELLSLGEAVGVVGDYLVAQPVANEKGSGCKYAAGVPEPTIEPTDFTDQFDQVGLLLGVLTPARSQELLVLFANQLEQTGDVQDTDALAALQALMAGDDYSQALAPFAALDWASTMWEVEPLAEIDDGTLLIYAALPPDGVRFYLFHSRADGGLYYMAGVSNFDLDTIRIALVNAAQKLIAAENE